MDAHDEGPRARPVPGMPAGTAGSGAPGFPDTTASPDALAPSVAASSVAAPSSASSDDTQGPRTGIAALSLGYRIVAALALAVVALTACVHIGMVFLHVAPANTASVQYSRQVGDWIYPEFEQNWKLFAPNPLQQNIAVEARADIRHADGTADTTRWYDLSASDGRAIDGSLLPSHTRQNELRRAWDFYAATHDTENRPDGLRGALSERYMLRIALLRLEAERGGRKTVFERVQLRSRTTSVPPPKWSDEKVSLTPVYRQLPWWPVSDGDGPVGTAEPVGAASPHTGKALRDTGGAAGEAGAR